MASSFREARDALLISYTNNIIDDCEFALLYDCNTSHNPDFSYWKYDSFDLEKLSDAECKAEFRIYRNDIYLLADLLNIPDQLICYNRTKVDQIEGLCMFLKRFAYPCRYGDMIPRFGRSVPEFSMISNKVIELVYSNYCHKLTDFNQAFLSPANLQRYAKAVRDKGATLDCCWGFVDGTVRPVCRPGQNQRILYNGHKREHSIKFQSVVTANGLIANLYGHMEGRRHDCALLAASGLMKTLQQHSHTPNGQTLCIYGDPAYPLRPHLLSPFKGARVTNQRDFNKSMSAVRISVEWIFGDIINYFKFLDFKENLKVGLSAVGKMHIVCALLHNIRTSLYKNTTSLYFGVDPPDIENYLQ